MSRLLLLYIYVMWPGLVIGDFNGPVDITVEETDNVLLTCSSESGVAIGFGTWADEAGTIASGETLIKDTGKYSNFELVADVANGQYDLRINNAEYEDEGMYSCQIGADPAISAMLTVEAQVTSVKLTVNGTDRSAVDVVAGEEQTLVCTAFGARPRVGIEWTNGEDSISGDTETELIIGDTIDTISTLLYTPTRNDNGHRFECVTTGQQAATPQSQSVTFNVQYAPIDIAIQYSKVTITCSSVANPSVPDDQYAITLNGIDTFTGKTLSYDREMYGCARVKCTATNTIGTGTGSPEGATTVAAPITVPICSCTSTGVGAIIGVRLSGIVIGAVAARIIIVLLV